MKLQIKVNVETGVIEDAKFKTFGCGSAIASSSLATEWLKGKTVDEALAIKNTDIVAELALPPVKIHCSVLAEDAIKAASQLQAETRGGQQRRSGDGKRVGAHPEADGQAGLAEGGLASASRAAGARV
jgi:nitrogen fixation NifU-like protein